MGNCLLTSQSKFKIDLLFSSDTCPAGESITLDKDIQYYDFLISFGRLQNGGSTETLGNSFTFTSHMKTGDRTYLEQSFGDEIYGLQIIPTLPRQIKVNQVWGSTKYYVYGIKF